MTTHSAFPGLCILDTGDWLCSYRVSTNHDIVTGTNRGIVYGKTSDDNGATWSTAFTIANDTVDEYDARGTTLLKLSNGDVLCFYTLAGATGNLRFPSVARSTDDASTWTDDIDITTTFTAGAFADQQGVELANGDVLYATYGKDSGDTEQSVRVSKSTDDGATWSHLAEIADGETDGRSYQEPCLVLLSNGDVFCMMRTSDNVYYSSTSTDSGATWSTASSMGIAGSGRPTLYQRSDGLLVTIIRPATGATASVIYSDDDGANWSHRGVWDNSSLFFVYHQMVQVSSSALAVAYALDDLTTASGDNGDVYLGHLDTDGVARP